MQIQDITTLYVIASLKNTVPPDMPLINFMSKVNTAYKWVKSHEYNRYIVKLLSIEGWVFLRVKDNNSCVLEINTSDTFPSNDFPCIEEQHMFGISWLLDRFSTDVVLMAYASVILNEDMLHNAYKGTADYLLVKDAMIKWNFCKIIEDPSY